MNTSHVHPRTVTTTTTTTTTKRVIHISRTQPMAPSQNHPRDKCVRMRYNLLHPAALVPIPIRVLMFHFETRVLRVEGEISFAISARPGRSAWDKASPPQIRQGLITCPPRCLPTSRPVLGCHMGCHMRRPSSSSPSSAWETDG